MIQLTTKYLVPAGHPDQLTIEFDESEHETMEGNMCC